MLSVCLFILVINIRMSEPTLINLGIYVMAPRLASTA
jgi:hypothetical protein